jgi:hypothetical protein
MRRVISTKREITESGTYQVDRIDDKIQYDLGIYNTIKPTNYKAALKLFKEDDLAYALRFVPSTTIFDDSKGQLVAYKESDFPKDLPFLTYQVIALPRVHSGINKGSVDDYMDFVTKTTQFFTDFYQHFPELMTAFHRELYMGLCQIQFSAICHDTKKVDSWSKYLDRLIEEYIAFNTRQADDTEPSDFERLLLHDDCLKFLGLDEEIQTVESEYEGPFDTNGETVQTKLGVNATSRENVIQAVESMFWNDVDQILIQSQLTRFRKDLIEKDLNNPLVYLEDDSEILSMEDPGELFYFVMMDDFWIRQFAYWMFNQHIEMFIELNTK